MKKKLCFLGFLFATMIPICLSAQGIYGYMLQPANAWAEPGHNPVLHLMQVPDPHSQQKGAAATSWLTASFQGWSGPSTGPYYTPQDSSTYTRSGGRGGAPSQPLLGGINGSFSVFTVPFDTMVLYGGWTDAAGRFTITGLKRIRTYDTGNRLLTDLEQNWKTGSGINSYRFIYTYTGSRLLTSVQQNWQSGAWLTYSKDSFGYNTAGQRTAHNSFYWYASPGTWLPVDRNYYFYDAAGNLLQDSMSQWINVSWKPYQQQQYTYGAAGQLYTQTTLTWAAGSNTWKFYQDETRSYNAGNHLFSIVTRDTFKYAATGHYRNIDSVVNTSLNSTGLPLITTVYEWRDNPAWTPARRYAETYNSFGQVTSEYGTHWDNNAWVVNPSGFDYAFRYYYATDSVTVPATVPTAIHDQELLLYPSPANERFYLLATAAMSGYYDAVVLDGNGRICMQWSVCLSSQQSEAADVSVLPPGQYWLQLRSEKGQVSRAFNIAR